jgi:hypothetical protein
VNTDVAPHKQLKRDIRAAALRRYEESCRTVDDFRELAGMYDKLDANAERRIRYWERLHYDGLEEWHPGDGKVIPPPIDHAWWIPLMRGDFLDVIFDCPHDIHELTSSRNVSQLVNALDENRKEILYYWAIRQWSPQKLAAYRNQTDRNIRKVYNKMIDELQAELYGRLVGRFLANESLTLRQRRFCENYKAALDGGYAYKDRPDELERRYSGKFSEYDTDTDETVHNTRDELYYDAFHYYNEDYIDNGDYEDDSDYEVDEYET